MMPTDSASMDAVPKEELEELEAAQRRDPLPSLAIDSDRSE